MEFHSDKWSSPVILETIPSPSHSTPLLVAKSKRTSQRSAKRSRFLGKLAPEDFHPRPASRAVGIEYVSKRRGTRVNPSKNRRRVASGAWWLYKSTLGVAEDASSPEASATFENPRAGEKRGASSSSKTDVPLKIVHLWPTAIRTSRESTGTSPIVFR